LPTIRIVESITEIDKNDWDRMIDDNVVASHGWLRTVEETHIVDLRPRYVLLCEARKPIAATVCYRSEPKDRVVDLDDLLFGRLKGFASSIGLSFLPALYCGPLHCYGKHFLIDPTLSGSMRYQAAAQLFDAIEQLATSESLSLFFVNLFDDEGEVLTLSSDRGYHKTSVFPACYLDVKWKSFEEYIDDVRGFSRNMSKNVKKEIRKSERAGIRIERIENIAPHESRLHELANAHWTEYNAVPFPYRAAFFSKILVNLENQAVFYGAFKGAELVGFSLKLERGGTAYGQEVGIDRSLPRTGAVYFSLCYYKLIMDAVAGETARFFFGRGLPEAKVRRGCKTRDTYMCYRADSKLKNAALQPLLAFYSFWSQRKTAARLGTRARGKEARRSSRSRPAVAEASRGD